MEEKTECFGFMMQKMCKIKLNPVKKALNEKTNHKLTVSTPTVQIITDLSHKHLSCNMYLSFVYCLVIFLTYIRLYGNL